jgi:hypothetical protein
MSPVLYQFISKKITSSVSICHSSKKKHTFPHQSHYFKNCHTFYRYFLIQHETVKASCESIDTRDTGPLREEKSVDNVLESSDAQYRETIVKVARAEGMNLGSDFPGCEIGNAVRHSSDLFRLIRLQTGTTQTSITLEPDSRGRWSTVSCLGRSNVRREDP